MAIDMILFIIVPEDPLWVVITGYCGPSRPVQSAFPNQTFSWIPWVKYHMCTTSHYFYCSIEHSGYYSELFQQLAPPFQFVATLTPEPLGNSIGTVLCLVKSVSLFLVLTH